MVTPIILSAAAGYLLGAVPFGYLVARSRGVNIFEVGSKNPGATNVRRVLGSGPGNLVFALDAAKGAVATALPWLLAATGVSWWETALNPPEGADLTAFAAAAPACVAGLVGALLGHSFSCFTGFRGGKGVATATGGFLVLMPAATLAAAAVWGITFYASRYVSLASILAAIALPIAAWVAGRPGLIIAIATAVGLFVLVRHRANIARLLAGTENRFQKKPTSSS